MKFKKAVNLFHIDRMMDHLVGFVETRLEILKLDFKEESVRIIAKLITAAVIGLFSTLFFIFFSVMIAIIINQALDSSYLGFAVLSAFFLLLLISVLVIKQTRWYNSKVIAITDQLVEDSEESEESNNGADLKNGEYSSHSQDSNDNEDERKEDERKRTPEIPGDSS